MVTGFERAPSSTRRAAPPRLRAPRAADIYSAPGASVRMLERIVTLRLAPAAQPPRPPRHFQDHGQIPQKTALIISGQDGAYLAELLLAKDAT